MSKKPTGGDEMNTEMIIKYRSQSGPAAKKTGDAIILNNMNLIRAIAAKYRAASPSIGMNDLINEGVIGLIEARERFNPKLGYEFSTYATYWVRRGILRALSETGHTIRVPERVAIAIPKLRRAVMDYVSMFGHEPDIEDVAGPLGLSKAIAMAAYHVLNEPASMTDEAGGGIDVAAECEPVDTAVLTKIRNAQLRKTIKQTLDEREAAVILGRFGLGDDEKEYTLTELGEQLGISREWVRQVELAAMAKLRHVIRRDL